MRPSGDIYSTIQLLLEVEQKHDYCYHDYYIKCVEEQLVLRRLGCAKIITEQTDSYQFYP